MGSATLTRAPVTPCCLPDTGFEDPESGPDMVPDMGTKCLTWALTWAPIAWWHGLQVPDMGSKSLTCMGPDMGSKCLTWALTWALDELAWMPVSGVWV